MKSKTYYIIDLQKRKFRSIKADEKDVQYSFDYQLNIVRGEDELNKLLSDYVMSDNNEELNYWEERTKKNYFNSENSTETYLVVGEDSMCGELVEKVCQTNCNLALLPIYFDRRRISEENLEKHIKELIKIINKDKVSYLNFLVANNQIGLKQVGLGFEANLINKTGRRKKRGLAYIYALLRTIFEFKPFYANVNDRFSSFEGIYWMISFSHLQLVNRHSYKQANSLNYDRYIEVTLVEPYPVLLFFVFLYHLCTGNFKRSKYAKCLKIKEQVYLRCSHVKMHVDYRTFDLQGLLKLGLSTHPLFCQAPDYS